MGKMSYCGKTAMMAEPCLLNYTTMTTINKTNKNPDGIDTTEQACIRTSTDERDTDTNDGRTMTTDERTMTTDERTMTTDGQIEMTTTMTMDEHAMTADVAESAAVAGGDPLACSSEALVTAEEVTGGDSSAVPLSSAPVTPMLPRKGYGSAVESSPSTSGRKGAGLGPQVIDVDGASHMEGIGTRLRRRVAGRKKITVGDDAEGGMQKSTRDDDAMSLTSASEDSSMASSSGVPRRKGTKRNRNGGKEKAEDSGSKGKASGSGSKEKAGEEDLEGKRRKKKRNGNGRETPEEEELNGPSGEPKGVVGCVFEDMSSVVLGGAVAEWVDQIEDMRKKSKNLHGKFSGAMKSLLAKIKEGAALLVVRSEAVGDPHFLRMRNSELTTRLKEVEKENGRLKEQARKASPGADSPLRKRKVEKRVLTATSADAENTAALREITPPNAEREEFPPLPQRTPRSRVGEVAAQRVSPPAAQRYTDAEDTEAESYLTQQINLLLAARNLERDRKRKEGQRRVWTGGQDNRKRIEERKRIENMTEGNEKRTGPRIVSDVQLVPPSEARFMEGASTPAMSASETEWRVAVGGRRRRNRDRRAMPPPPPPIDGQASERRVVRGGADHRAFPPQRPPRRQTSRGRLPKPPRTSAVTITGLVEGFSYATALKGAREKIDLEAMGIQTSRVRKAINGGLLIEIPGEDSKIKAEELTARLRSVFGESAAVSCPVKKREIRITGFDESVTQGEIAEVLSSLGECPCADVRIGAIRMMNNGLGAVWAQLPIAAALKVAEIARARIGWTIARIELLGVRPLQCYKCWEYGHVQGACRNSVDRRGACFNCGQRGHTANGCRNSALCMVCTDQGLDASHRLGGPRCLAQTQTGAMSDRRPARLTNNNNVQVSAN